MLIFITILGFVLLILGFIGCILPAIPGPPLSYVAILLLSIVQKFADPLNSKLLIILALITVFVTVIDYVVPVAGAKKYGSSKWGVWGAIIGMIIGTIFYPPFGMLIGAFLGAVFVEMVIGKTGKEAMRAGWGVFIGTMVGVILKLFASGLITYYYIYALF